MLGLPDSSIAKAKAASAPPCATAASPSSGTGASPSTWPRPACARRARPTTWPPRWACWPPTACVTCAPLRSVLLVGELALDGAVRPVSGVLPMCSWPGAPAWKRPSSRPRTPREAAAVGGLHVYPVASLREAIALAGCRAAPGRRRPRPRCRRRPSCAPTSPTCAASRWPGGPSRSPRPAGTTCCSSGPPGLGQDHAGPAAARHPAPAHPRGGAGDHGHPLGRRAPGRRAARRSGPSAAPTTRPATPALVGGGSQPASGRGQPGPPRRALPRRAARVPAGTCSKRCASPWKTGWSRVARARGSLRAARPVPAGGGDEPLPLRLARRSRPRLPLPARPRSPPTSAASPARCSTASTCMSRYRRFLHRTSTGRRASASPGGREGGGGTGTAGRTAAPGGATTNASLDPARLRLVATPDAAGHQLLRAAMDRLRLSGRGHDRLLRVARTIADLEGRAAVNASDVAEALQFRAVAEPQ